MARDPAKPDANLQMVRKEGAYWYYFDEIERDASGAHPSPLELQRNFMAAVVKAMEQAIVLSADQIAKDRLGAEGVGPFAPVARNPARQG